MTGGHQTRTDASFQVAHRGPNARLHRFAGEMVTAEHEVDGNIREAASRLQACVDDPCMRTSGNDGQASAGHAGRDEPFIYDQRVGGALVAAKGMVPGEALLIGGDAGDCPAAKKEAVADRMGSIMGYDLTRRLA